MNQTTQAKSRRGSSRRKDATICKKLDLIRKGEPPRLLDIFSGCGGMTLGFKWANCRSVGGIEQDPVAARSYACNFHEGEEELHGRSRDVAMVDADGLATELGWEGGDAAGAVDIILAGPPCPSFSRAGRAKLASLNGGKVSRDSTGSDKEAYLTDHRTDLYLEVVELAKQLKPVAVVMENVPEFLQHGGTNHGEIACERLEALGYHCLYSILNAAHYGVPQWRDRFIMIAIHKDAGAMPEMPKPTHSLKGQPIGYKGRLTHLDLEAGEGGCETSRWHVPTPEGGPKRPVFAKAAIGDLPWIKFEIEDDGFAVRIEHQWGEGGPFKYLSPANGYARLMRREGRPDRIDHMHVTRRLSMKTARDQRIFERMPQGAEYREALSHAWGALEEHLASLKSARPAEGSKEYDELKKRFIPPYPEDKFNNKWWKLVEGQPSRTLTAHIGKDTYSHIHYDADQRRTITVLEAMRLQSIPDGFRLAGKMNDRFRQIGNSVPPLMAKAIAKQLLQDLRVTPSTCGRGFDAVRH